LVVGQDKGYTQPPPASPVMTTKKIIKQVSYPGHGESPFKTVAFLPTMTVAEACAICAQKGGLKDKMDMYGLCIKDTGTWLQDEKSLSDYPAIEQCAGLEYKPTPKKTTVTYEGQEKKAEIDFSQTGSDVLATVLDVLGEPRSNEYSLSIYSEVDGSKGPSVDYSKPLIEQADPSTTKLVVKKKSKIGTIFRRTDSHKSRRESSITREASTTQPSAATKVFGVPLAQCAHRFKYGGLPVVVAKTMTYLTESALQLEGIFRISGNQTEVLALKKAFDEGQDVNIRTCSSPHVAAGLLKLYLRDLPEPLFTFRLYDIFMALYNTVQNEAVRLTYCKVIVDTLPVANRTLLFALLPFLASVMKFADVNKMAVHNIATVFGPNLLRSADDSAITMIQGTAAINAITCELIENYEEIVQETGENEDFVSIGLSQFAYEGKSDRELSFQQGEVIFVSNETDASWWEGEANGNFGFFPANYVQRIVSLRSDAPAPTSTQPPKESPKESAAPPKEPAAPVEEAKETPPPKPEPTPTPKETASSTTSETPAKPAAKPAPRKKPAGGAGGAGSKQKFMTDLEDLKVAASAEAESHVRLLALVEKLSQEVEQLKQAPARSPSTSTGGANLASLSSARAEMKMLGAANDRLEGELKKVREDISAMQNALEALKGEEATLKKDLKIIQLQVKPAGGPARRAAPMLPK